MRRMWVAIAAALVLLLAGQAFGAAIMVANPGFEQVSGPFSNTLVMGGVTQYWTPTTVAPIVGWSVTPTNPAWASTDPAGVWLPDYSPEIDTFMHPDEGACADPMNPGPSWPDCDIVAYSNGAAIYQVLNVNSIQNSVYTLSVLVGRRAEAFEGPGNIVVPQDFAIRLYAGDLLLREISGNTATLVHNDWTNIQFSVNSGLAATAPLKIVLWGSGPQVDFDDVWLDVIVPEPATLILTGSTLLLFGWYVRRRRKSPESHPSRSS